jgi:hypothetical protein
VYLKQGQAVIKALSELLFHFVLSLFCSSGHVWVAGTGSQVRKPSPLFLARGVCSQCAWSPSGDKLAFVNERRDPGGGERWSFCGVFNMKTGATTYLSPSTHLDQFPVFSPDDEKVAFVRVTPNPTHVPGLPQPQVPESWRIMVADLGNDDDADANADVDADADTGDNDTYDMYDMYGKQQQQEVRCVCLWQALVGDGSRFISYSGEEALIWSAAGYLLFPWEKTGWLHIYSLAVGMGQGLFPGESEDEDVGVGAAGVPVQVCTGMMTKS